MDILKEIETEQLLTEPYLVHSEDTLLAKKKVAYNIFSRKPEEILLLGSLSLLVDSVLAGLTESQVEHIAKYGPKNYKESLVKGLGDRNILDEVMKIAKAMDEELGNGVTKHQERIKSVFQYLRDNRIIFQF